MEVTVGEAPGQEAVFRWAIPPEAGPDFSLDVRSFITDGAVIPMPCPSETKPKAAVASACCPNCQPGRKPDFSLQLERIAQAINNGEIQTGGSNGGSLSAEDLEKFI